MDNYPEGRMNLPGSPLKGSKKMDNMCPFDHFESPCDKCGDPMCIKKEDR